MRISAAFPLALPLLASAQQQIPFLDTAKSLLAQAQGFIAGGENNAASMASRGASGASSVAGYAASRASGASDDFADIAHQAARPVTSTVANAAVHELTLDNWKQTLVHSGSARPGSPAEPWFVGITGGNKTCGGRCGKFDLAWNEAATVLAADPDGPHLAHINCDDAEILCGALTASASQVWVFQVPHPAGDQSTPSTPMTIFYQNITTVTAQDITSIHTEKKYLTADSYTGGFHPFDGWVAQAGLTLPMAYFLWGMAKIPSWAFMIGVSVFSRYFVSKRMPNGAPPFARPAPGAAPGAAPAAGGARPAR